MSARRTDTSYLVNQYLEYLEVEKGSSPLTIRNYKHYLLRFLAFSKQSKAGNSVTDIKPDVIREYRLFLSRLPSHLQRGAQTGPSPSVRNVKVNPLSRKTQGYHVIALRSFLRWLIKNDYKVMSPDKIDLPKVEDRQVNFLSGQQIDRLLNAPSLSTIIGKRDKAILELLYSTGLRVSELVKLNRDKMDFSTREFGIVGKGGKARVVFLSKRAAKWVKNYVDERKDHFTPLFIRHKGKVEPTTESEEMRLSARSIQRMIKKYSHKMKLPVNVTPHVIRHSFATDLLMAGADLRSVQEMLGHKNVQTTQIYTHVTNKQLKDVHDAFHAGNK